jgi:hypothetical protein
MQRQHFRDGIAVAEKLVKLATGDEKAELTRNLNAIGTENDRNDVEVNFGNQDHSSTDGADPSKIKVIFTASDKSSLGLGLAILHGGSHTADWHDFNAFASVLGMLPRGPSLYEGEQRAYTGTSYALSVLGVSPGGLGAKLEKDIAGLPAADRETARATAIDAFLAADPAYAVGRKPLSASNPGPTYRELRQNFFMQNRFQR